MAILREAYIETECIKLAKKSGYNTRKVKFIASNGAPDRIFFKSNHFFWCEFKNANGVLSELQKHQQKLLKDAGQEVYNINDIDLFSKLLKST